MITARPRLAVDGTFDFVDRPSACLAHEFMANDPVGRFRRRPWVAIDRNGDESLVSLLLFSSPLE
ncbi:hypothetical protein [Bradyrhizobium valentinum]|uniref:hypothetical protein n=1 Tax=Bradyrhizobium valentinum TaxID=1518501 RepID=UPI0012E3B37D|nr:hypothetical protein [Bradyrhizobium valentinum]